MESAQVWYVRSSSGGVHRLTLDELDRAFRAGRVSARSMVVPETAVRWTRLGNLAGIDEDTRPVVPPSERPVSLDLTELLPPATRRGPGWRTAVCALALTIGVATGLGLRSPASTRALGRRATALVAGAKQWASDWRVARANQDKKPASTGLRDSVAQDSRASLAPPATPEIYAAGLWTPIPYRKPEAQAAAVPAIAATALPVAVREDRAGVGRAPRAATERRTGRKSHPRLGTSKSSAPASPDDQSGFTTGGNKFDPLNSGISP